MMFKNREEAGMLLADKLSSYKNRSDTVVLAIPRGGVVVGTQIAKNLSLPLSVVVVKKLGAPGNPELAIGAAASGGVKYIDWDLALRSGVEQDYLDSELATKRKEIEKRAKKFNIKHSTLNIKNKKCIILVDDGVATGATVMAAIKYIKENVKSRALSVKIILAVPVIAKDTYDKLQLEVEKIIALKVVQTFGAVGQFYSEFPQVSDEEVVNILKSVK